jgi:DNA-binding protein H-NS
MLDGLEDADLLAVGARCEELLKEHDRQRKDKALEQARAILTGVGLSLKDVAGKPHKNGKTQAYHSGRKYQHPTNKTLMWNARGQKPIWLRELEASGAKALEVGNA